ncbi:hypothetical protein BKA57DRAFT_533145 [Linnemannia elongata]|nr:hypothetical protein BKA57DRAFT_533145 [Linnemannia elongata]
MKADTIFDLPELLDVLGTHLSQRTLYRCIQVSKIWHATFIPHLWRTFTERPVLQSKWSRDLFFAIQAQISDPQNLEWYKDVYRRHAKYIRHLTICTPTILDACLDGAFEQLRSELYSANASTGSSGTTTTKPASASTAVNDVGGSLMTNLESLDLNILNHTIAFYFQMQLPGGSFGQSSTSVFTSTGFGTSLSDANTNNITGENNNSSNSTNNATTNSTLATTVTAASLSPLDTEKAFIKACQRLVLNNPRLRTLSSVYSMKILQDLEGGVGSFLRSLKNLACVPTDGLIPGVLPPNVTHLKLISSFGLHLNAYSFASKGLGTTALVHEGLKSLEVDCVESATHIKGLLTQTPSLQTLSINTFLSSSGFGGDYATAAPIPVGLSWPASQITVLKCKQTRGVSSSSSGFEDFLSCFPLLVEYHDEVWFPAIGAQLAKYCPLLEVIRIYQAVSEFHSFATDFSPCHRPKGLPVNDSVSILLTGLTRLRILDIRYEAIKAENILETPWVCLDLETFRCQIAEVPFLTDEEEQQVQEIRQRETQATSSALEYIRTDEEDALIVLSERCVHTREGIMAQLSKLTSLKFLSLSPDFKTGSDLFGNHFNPKRVYKSERDGRSYIRYDDVMPDTLYFRLNNGLHQLASLTKLEYLSFESIDHRMETADIEWFASHLPRLREMRGLVTEAYVGMEPDPKNDVLVALIRKLRPDVVQNQSLSAGSLTSIGQISSVSTITILSSVIPNQKVGAAFGAQCIWQQLHRSSAT